MVSALTQEGADVTLQAPRARRVRLLAQAREEPALPSSVPAETCSSPRCWPPRQRGRRQRPAGRRRGRRPLSVRRPAARFRSRRQAAKPTRGTAESSHASEFARPQSRSVSVIGISTGGPQALSQDLPRSDTLRCRRSSSSSTCRPSSPGFSPSGSIATRTFTVKQAEEGDLVLPDQVLVAPGGVHLVLTGSSAARPGRALARSPGERPPAFGRRAVPIRGQGLPARSRRHLDDRHGPRRRRRLQGNSCRRRADPRSG